jgi:predicted nucleic acid-binding protein
MILLDTSVWILTFRKQRPLDLESLVPLHEVVVCLPVVQEILQGFDDERPYRIARDALFAMPMVEAPLAADRFVEAAGLYRSCRRAGLTPRSGVDCLIAAIAIHHDVEIWHADRDYEFVARVSNLRQRTIRA